MEHLLRDLPKEKLDDIAFECRLYEAGFYQDKDDLARAISDIIYS